MSPSLICRDPFADVPQESQRAARLGRQYLDKAPVMMARPKSQPTSSYHMAYGLLGAIVDPRIAVFFCRAAESGPLDLPEIANAIVLRDGTRRFTGPDFELGFSRVVDVAALLREQGLDAAAVQIEEFAAAGKLCFVISDLGGRGYGVLTFGSDANAPGGSA